MAEELLWRDIPDGHRFPDGSRLTQVHETHTCECYRITIDNGRELTVSGDHLLLCDLSRALSSRRSTSITEEVLSGAPSQIPVVEDIHLYPGENGEVIERSAPCAYDNTRLGGSLYWLPASVIAYLRSVRVPVYLTRDLREQQSSLDWVSLRTHSDILEDETRVVFTRVPIESIDYVGRLECFCISTDTGRYQLCGVISHNSVTLRNVIMHSLTHGDEIKIGLVDLKLSEFTSYKGMNNVVGVANSTREAAELLRLCREVMQKRNRQNADRGLTDYKDYKPQHPTDQISLFGEHYSEDTQFDVEINGEHKTMTAAEILEYVQSSYTSDK